MVQILDKRQIAENQARNAQFFRDVSSNTALEKTSASYKDVIMSHVKEFSVYNRIIPPREVTNDELEVGPNNDSLYFRIHVAPDTRAGLSSFSSGLGEFQEVRADRFFGTFQMLATPYWEFNEYRMAAYPFPLPKMIEDNVGIDFQECRDWVLHKGLEDMIAKNRVRQKMVYKGVNVTAGTGDPDEHDRVKLTVGDFLTARRHFAGRTNGIHNALIPETNYIDLSEHDLNDLGDQLKGDTFVNGYNKDTVSGLRFIRTIKIDNDKGDIFRRDNVYFFGHPDEIGRNFDYQGIKTHLVKEAQFVRFAARMAFGHVWTGNNRVCKIELYQTGTQPDSVTGLGTTVADRAGTMGSSDVLWADPELAMEHDYNDITSDPMAPVIRYS